MIAIDILNRTTLIYGKRRLRSYNVSREILIKIGLSP